MSICVWAQGDSLRSFSASFRGNSIQAVLRFCADTAAAAPSTSNTATMDFIEGLCIDHDRAETFILHFEWEYMSAGSSKLKLAVIHHLGDFEALADLNGLTDLGKEAHVAAVGVNERLTVNHSRKDKLGPQNVARSPIFH